MKTDGGNSRSEGAFADSCKDIVPDTFRKSSLAKEPLPREPYRKNTPFSSYE